MVTYDALFAYSLVIIGLVGLVILICKRNDRPSPKEDGHFV